MKSINWTTLIAFVAVVAADTSLTLTGHPVPAVITGALGTLGVALMPALAGKQSGGAS